MTDKTILVVGTYDTKDDELTYMSLAIRQQGCYNRPRMKSGDLNL